MSRLTRDDIVVGAGRRFATYGYHGTSMRDLGEDLGILGSSIYSHIGGKQELLIAVVERGAAFFEEAASTVLAIEAPPEERMRGLIAGHIGVLLDQRPEARTYLTQVDCLDKDEAERINKMRDEYEGAFYSTIVAGIDEGVFREDCDPRLAAIYVLSILNALERWYDEQGRLSRSEIVEDMYRFVIGALT